MVVQPPGQGYWVDGGDADMVGGGDLAGGHAGVLLGGSGDQPMDCVDARESSNGGLTPSGGREYKLEMDETAKCYRRHFLGKVWWRRGLVGTECIH